MRLFERQRRRNKLVKSRFSTSLFATSLLMVQITDHRSQLNLHQLRGYELLALAENI